MFVWTWEKAMFLRFSAAVLSRCSSGITLEATSLGRIVKVVGPDALVVAIHGGLHVHVEAFTGYLGSGYRQALIE